jgi:hypothetical protein
MFFLFKEKQTIKPIPKKNKRAYLNECITYETNRCKWKAASLFCEDKNWEFKILTEENLFKTNNKKESSTDAK